MTKEEFDKIPIGEKRHAVNSSGETIRWKKKSEDIVLVYAKGKRKQGWYHSTTNFLANHKIKDEKPKDENASWHRRVRRVIKLLRQNGLWAEILSAMENVEKMEYEELLIFQNKATGWNSPNIQECSSIDEYNERTKAFYGDLYTKYPFLFEVVGGAIRPVWEYATETYLVRTKSMFFGKYLNAGIKQEIKKALAEKRSYKLPHTRVGYDISFDYDAERGRAWYREEYKNCGNGYAYLAISESTAIFYEKD